MITAQQMPQKQLTPADLKPEQDMLNLAGSKVSFKDIYAREIDLPVLKNKYYAIDDVDDLFILINGIFTTISEQSYRNTLMLTEERQNVSELTEKLVKLQKDFDALVKQNQDLVQKNAELMAEQEKVPKQAELDKLQTVLQIAATKLQEQNEIIRQQNVIIQKQANIK